MEKLIQIQQELHAPKSKYNKYGDYNYRSCEDITEALKPLEAKYKCLITLTDEIVTVDGRFYVKATARFTDGSFVTESYGWAREVEEKKGMDGSQITGTASSYARKYALNGLLMIDDVKDTDTEENRNERDNRTAGKTATPKAAPKQPAKTETADADVKAKFIKSIQACKSNEELDGLIKRCLCSDKYKALMNEQEVKDAGKAARKKLSAVA